MLHNILFSLKRILFFLSHFYLYVICIFSSRTNLFCLFFLCSFLSKLLLIFILDSYQFYYYQYFLPFILLLILQSFSVFAPVFLSNLVTINLLGIRFLVFILCVLTANNFTWMILYILNYLFI